MENPAAWTEVERVIARADTEWTRDLMAQGLVGGSRPLAIAAALREAGLLKEEHADASDLSGDSVGNSYDQALKTVAELTDALAAIEKRLFVTDAAAEHRSAAQAAAETLSVIRRTLDRERGLWLKKSSV